MTPEVAAILLFRMLGIVMLLLAFFSLVAVPVSYFSLLSVSASNDTYFVAGGSVIWGGLLGVGGFAVILFSKALGRLLAKGLR